MLGYLTLGLFDLSDHALARGGEIVLCIDCARRKQRCGENHARRA
jgi:hypothetical protein